MKHEENSGPPGACDDTGDGIFVSEKSGGKAPSGPSVPAGKFDIQQGAATPVSMGRLLRLPEVLRLMAVGRSTWYSGIRTGLYPAPVRPSARTVAWGETVIHDLIRRLALG